MTDLKFIVLTQTLGALFSTRAANSFGFADLYSQDPDLQLERCSESSVSVHYFQLCFMLSFRCYVIYCNL